MAPINTVVCPSLQVGVSTAATLSQLGVPTALPTGGVFLPGESCGRVDAKRVGRVGKKARNQKFGVSHVSCIDIAIF